MQWGYLNGILGWINRGMISQMTEVRVLFVLLRTELVFVSDSGSSAVRRSGVHLESIRKGGEGAGRLGLRKSWRKGGVHL